MYGWSRCRLFAWSLPNLIGAGIGSGTSGAAQKCSSSATLLEKHACGGGEGVVTLTGTYFPSQVVISSRSKNYIAYL